MRGASLEMDSAVRLIAGKDPKLLQAADRLLGLGLLLAPVVAGPAGLGALAFIDPKNEAVAAARDLINRAMSKASGTRGRSRAELLVAAHTVTVVAAYFDALKEEVGDDLYQRLDLADREKLRLSATSPHTVDAQQSGAGHLPVAGPRGSFAEPIRRSPR